MAVYTTTIRNYLESFSYGTPGLSIEQKINIGMPHLFDFTFPIYDETYRPVLQRNIVNYYYFYEIGLETMEAFKFYLAGRLNLIMPRYNKMYAADLLTIDPLNNVNYKTTHNKKNNATSDSTANTRDTTNYTDNRADNDKYTHNGLLSDTPQGVLSGGDYASALNKDDDTRNVTSDFTHDGTATGNATTNQVINNVEDFILSKVGHDGISQAELLNQYRNSLINIDQMIINDLKDLFMLIY